MIVDNIGIKPLGKDECVLTGNLTQNNIPVLEQNYVEKMNSNNGFSEKRLFRKIASIPVVAHIKAYQDGYNLEDRKDLERFLAENPDYMSVERLNSHRSPNLIIK